MMKQFFSKSKAFSLLKIAKIFDKAECTEDAMTTRIEAARDLLEETFNLAEIDNWEEALSFLSEAEKILKNIEVWRKADEAAIHLARALYLKRLGKDRLASDCWAISYHLESKDDLTIELGIRWGLLKKNEILDRPRLEEEVVHVKK